MPLITLCGLPLSGKTTRAKQLKAVIDTYISNSNSYITGCLIINDEFLGLSPKSSYADANSEKKARACLLSAIERHLSNNLLVICDSLCYIKGFRYQLYCIARAMGTTVGTVWGYLMQIWCVVQPNDSVTRNIEIERYDSQILGNLCSRFEDPDGRNRWDAPLFIIFSQDSSLEDKTNTMGLDIISQVILKVAPAPNVSTIVQPIGDHNYLNEIDTIAGTIISGAIEAQRDGRMGKVVIDCKTKNAILNIPSRNITLSEWRRLKKQYIQMNKTQLVHDMDVFTLAFCDYINSNLA